MYLAFIQHSIILVVPVIVLIMYNALLSAYVVDSLISCVGSASAHMTSPFYKYRVSNQLGYISDLYYTKPDSKSQFMQLKSTAFQTCFSCAL